MSSILPGKPRAMRDFAISSVRLGQVRQDGNPTVALSCLQDLPQYDDLLVNRVSFRAGGSITTSPRLVVNDGLPHSHIVNNSIAEKRCCHSSFSWVWRPSHVEKRPQRTKIGRVAVGHVPKCDCPRLVQATVRRRSIRYDFWRGQLAAEETLTTVEPADERH